MMTHETKHTYCIALKSKLLQSGIYSYCSLDSTFRIIIRSSLLLPLSSKTSIILGNKSSLHHIANHETHLPWKWLSCTHNKSGSCHIQFLGRMYMKNCIYFIFFPFCVLLSNCYDVNEQNKTHHYKHSNDFIHQLLLVLGPNDGSEICWCCLNKTY
jgi:hypothetical protein